MTLDERKKKILESVIIEYVETAEPVGSRAVVKKHNLNISAATARNEMSDLEEMGYMEQPHTSAGRIPSEMGFRYYVDRIMLKESPTEQEIQMLGKILKEKIVDWDETIATIARYISQLTHYTAFVVAPGVDSSEIRLLQLVPLEPGLALLLVVTDMGIIMHRKIDLPDSINVNDLQIVGGFLNKAFQGKKLSDIRRSDMQLVRDDLAKQRKRVVNCALEAIDHLFGSKNEKVVISGTLNILNEPEFKDYVRLKKILTLLEEEVLFRELIPDDVGDDITIRIGKENKVEDAQDMSLVVGGYSVFGEMGKIGVIGPVRMEYWKAAGTVETIQAFLGDFLKQHF
ncbi:MAG: heat-inducible transcriptional repressor HrcA [Syntrophomonadaceae bacterium]